MFVPRECDELWLYSFEMHAASLVLILTATSSPSNMFVPRERDELWSKCEEMRTALSSAQSERDDLMSKVALLRAEAKSAISDLKNDR
eukprot:1158079-Pelagomonas_calceolata.AAC.2